MANIFDLTGIDDFGEILVPVARNLGFEVGTADDLAAMPLSGLSEHVAILSDNRFSEQQADTEILEQVQALANIGLNLLYIGTPRETPEFLESLEETGVQAFLREELDPDELLQWIASSLSSFQTKVPASQVMQDEIAGIPAAQEPSTSDLTCPLCIVVSAAPGCGATFIGLNLATMLSESRAMNYVEAGLRPVLTTWLSAEAEEEQASLAAPFRPAVLRDDLAVYTRNPFGEEAVDLHQVASATAKFVDPVVMDLGLQEYLATADHDFAQRTLRVLVTTADVHRCRYLEGLPADVVVVNQVPKRLPFDESEFAAFWPESKLVFVPYEEEQCQAIAQGLPASEVSEAVRSAMRRLQEALFGGDEIANRIAG
ncbi:hypothetical protein [Alicyclobacillus macrosporangiidus]|uniref:Uncharacterized protein n=1 Tax=Alicyclobacillus macrosporangiidus TaxID=392015 RepID=A0A1I7LBE5_9BACL|nr:hypothetical protein [Alicyclobacillus macrosporangiidus]SFV07015.1 hypothetical protein SAMN05421543_1337 [Alicyclobacillus macrosporangiidus]